MNKTKQSSLIINLSWGKGAAEKGWGGEEGGGLNRWSGLLTVRKISLLHATIVAMKGQSFFL